MKRTIVFGDIHGCYREWQDLLEKAAVTAEDDLYAVGDLVCKGPSTKRTLDLALSLPNLKCVLGNHEHYILDRWMNDDLHNLIKGYQEDALREMGRDLDRYMKYIASWPLYYETDHCIVIHAGLRPGVTLQKQAQKDLLHLRTVPPDNRPWHEHYKGRRLVVYGHWARQGLCVKSNSIGLDTGCVYGRELSCVILPQRQILSVPARRVYQEPVIKK